jgi:hypothetical protein
VIANNKRISIAQGQITMKSPALLTILCGLNVSHFGFSNPVYAESSSPPVAPTPTMVSTAGANIPQSTAIIISFPQALNIDANQDREYPITGMLAQPIRSSQGQVIVPENSHVSLVLTPTKEGILLVAKSLVINGQVVPCQAISQLIPWRSITTMRSQDKAKDNMGVYGKFGEGLGGLFGGGSGSADADRGNLIGRLVGGVAGLATPETSRVVEIPQNSVYILSLLRAIHFN